MTLQELQSIAAAAATAHGIDPSLVLCVCDNESSFNPWSVRYEPGFYSRYIEKMTGLSDTEKTMRATSFGLMQVMGQVAREKGFSGKFLTELLDPIESVNFGCKKLRECLDKENGDVRAALLRYNGGGDSAYPDRVLKFMDKYR